jgi:DNA uptake protein ComE-like DNA-binding protein
MSRNLTLAGLGFVIVLNLAACSASGASSTEAATTTASPSASATEPAATSIEPTVSESAAAVSNVNANTATVAELQAAFEAVGIPNADKWAREVEEYRPYPADPTWAQLRQELGKYNIDPVVLEQIIAILEV